MLARTGADSLSLRSIARAAGVSATAPYNHFAFITYNVPAVPNKGSAFFLHQGNGKATAGCVSLGAGDLVEVLRWLDPAAAPRIVMAPKSLLGRY